MLTEILFENVNLYRNLNQGRAIGMPFCSIKYKGKVQKEYPRFAKVIDCKFHVNVDMQQEIFNGRSKEVHAWIKGTLTAASEKVQAIPSDYIACNYNPRISSEFFIRSSGVAITQCDAAIFCEGKIYCQNPR